MYSIHVHAHDTIPGSAFFKIRCEVRHISVFGLCFGTGGVLCDILCFCFETENKSLLSCKMYNNIPVPFITPDCNMILPEIRNSRVQDIKGDDCIYQD